MPIRRTTRDAMSIGPGGADPWPQRHWSGRLAAQTQIERVAGSQTLRGLSWDGRRHFGGRSAG